MSAAAQVSNPLFARVWTVMAAHETDELTRLRRENLAGLTGRVLEIGAGTGTNFAHYPQSVTEVVAVEPEPGLLAHARKAAAAAPVPVHVSGETAETVPDLGVFDAAVCSLVLCTVDDPETVLVQLLSRLRPGGELRYMEHVAGIGWRSGVQRAADATVWPRLFGGCHTHRHTERTIAGAGFTVATARRQWALPRWVPLPVGEFAVGRAVKPGGQA